MSEETKKSVANFVQRYEEILDPNMDIIDRIGRMARLCYRTEPKEGEDQRAVNERIIRQCIKSGHESILEHGIISVYIPVEEIRDSFTILKTLVGTEDSHVIFRNVWEHTRNQTQQQYAFAFPDSEIEAKNKQRFNYPQVVGTRILPCLTADVRAWRLIVREKLFTIVNGRRDPLEYVTGMAVLNALNTSFPVFFEDLANDVVEFFKNYNSKEGDEKDPLFKYVFSKLEDNEKTVEGIVKKFFQDPNEFMAESASKCTCLSVILTTDRATTHQIVRHRVNVAYSQESQRYVNYDKKGFNFIIPVLDPMKHADHNPNIDKKTGELLPDSETFKVWSEAMTRSAETYQTLVNANILPPESARGVLPNDTATKIGITWFMPNGFSNFVYWRLDSHAQFSIRSTIARIITRGILDNHPFFHLINPEVTERWINLIKEMNLAEEAEITKMLELNADRQKAINEELERRKKEYLDELAKRQEEEKKRREELKAKGIDPDKPQEPKVVKLGQPEGFEKNPPETVTPSEPTVSFEKPEHQEEPDSKEVVE